MTKNSPVEDVSVDGGVIRLGQFLKFSSLIDSGGNAKDAISEGHVHVNGKAELRRGYQLKDGDVVTFQERSVRVRY